MTITIEAIYESGALRLLQPIPYLREHERVKVTVEAKSVVELLLQNRIEIDPIVAREIIENPDYSLLNI